MKNIIILTILLLCSCKPKISKECEIDVIDYYEFIDSGKVYISIVFVQNKDTFAIDNMTPNELRYLLRTGEDPY